MEDSGYMHLYQSCVFLCLCMCVNMPWCDLELMEPAVSEVPPSDACVDPQSRPSYFRIYWAVLLLMKCTERRHEVLYFRERNI